MKMRNSYISNSAEALNLHNGSQTAIVVAMKVQPKLQHFVDTFCKYGAGSVNSGDLTAADSEMDDIYDSAPYALGQEVYVRESWVYRHKHDKYYYKADHSKFEPYCHQGWKSAATMPKSAARTRFKIVGCEAVRVYDVNIDNIRAILGHTETYKNIPNLNHYFKQHIVSKFGKSAWNNNDYIWFYKIEKI